MEAIPAFVRQTKKRIAELNLFKYGTCRSDSFHLRTAILSTRVYIVLLSISVITLVVFISLGTQSEVITIRNPSETEYKTFLEKYGSLSSCPCSRVTIPYGNFTSTTIDYHPVCQSVFVSEDWINHLFSPNFTSIYQRDFRALAGNYFQLLATFCSYVNRSVRDALDNFHSQTLLTSDVLLLNSLYAQINEISQFLQFSTANSVTQLLQIVCNTTQSNGLQTAIPMSTMMKSTIGNKSLLAEEILFRYKKSTPTRCYCTGASKCSTPSGFFNISVKIYYILDVIPNFPLLDNVSGFFVGCNPLASLLQSTLECLFDSSCLKIIHKYIPSSNITGVYALNISQTRFPPNTSTETLIRELFIEKWLMEPSFSKYYAQCAPILCTHTLLKRNNPLYILTKLLSLYGGLTATLRFCIPLIVTWCRKRKMIASAETRPSAYRYLKNPRLILLKF